MQKQDSSPKLFRVVNRSNPSTLLPTQQQPAEGAIELTEASPRQHRTMTDELTMVDEPLDDITVDFGNGEDDDDDEQIHDEQQREQSSTTRMRKRRITYVVLAALLVVVVVVVVSLQVRRGDAPSEVNSDLDGTGTNTSEPPPADPTQAVPPTPPTTTSGASPASTTPAPPTTTTTTTTTAPPDALFQCTGDDRLNHEEKLESGQVLCSTNAQYVFGMYADGSLVKRDITSDSGKNDVFYTGTPGDYFVMHSNGDMCIYNQSDALVWKREPLLGSGEEIQVTSCLDDYPCPYMHLHNDGVLVVNWKDSSGQWNADRIKELYNVS